MPLELCTYVAIPASRLLSRSKKLAGAEHEVHVHDMHQNEVATCSLQSREAAILDKGRVRRNSILHRLC